VVVVAALVARLVFNNTGATHVVASGGVALITEAGALGVIRAQRVEAAALFGLAARRALNFLGEVAFACHTSVLGALNAVIALVIRGARSLGLLAVRLRGMSASSCGVAHISGACLVIIAQIVHGSVSASSGRARVFGARNVVGTDCLGSRSGGVVSAHTSVGITAILGTRDTIGAILLAVLALAVGQAHG
jgi:hypothetical protein